MPTERLLNILEMLSREHSDHHSDTLCAVAAELTELSGAGIFLLSGGPQYTKFCSSDDVADKLLDLEITLGEGPGNEACNSGVALHEDDLLFGKYDRWLAYAPAAVAIGARSIFAFPIGIGAIRIGALILYRDRPGPLTERQESDAYLVASVIGRAILETRAGATELDLRGELGLAHSLDFSVHQAAGMVAVQGSLSLDDALVALRSHAFGSGVSMTTMAQSVVRRETTYDPESRRWRGKEARNP